MASLSFIDVNKRYGDNQVLKDLSFSIEQGEFIVVVGPSGCGKSSLLRMVAGLEPLSSGKILINSQFINEVEAKKRDIAMVFQNYALYPHMSVYDNMAYGLKMRKVSKAHIKERVYEVATTLQLSPYLSRKPGELSGGQRQRVAMGRAIVRQPSVFLFDEPLSNLDAKLRTQMRFEIKKLQQRLGITSLYVTHDQTEAMTLADRLIILNEGVIEQFDTPLAVYSKPKTAFVADFMGMPTMNFIDVTLSECQQQLSLDNGYRIQLAQKVHQIDRQSPVKLGIRPEDFRLKAGDGMPFKVNVVEALGSEMLIYGELSSQLPLVVRSSASEVVKPGEQLLIDLNKDKLHFFDSHTGMRLSFH